MNDIVSIEPGLQHFFLFVSFEHNEASSFEFLEIIDEIKKTKTEGFVTIQDRTTPVNHVVYDDVIATKSISKFRYFVGDFQEKKI